MKSRSFADRHEGDEHGQALASELAYLADASVWQPARLRGADQICKLAG